MRRLSSMIAIAALAAGLVTVAGQQPAAGHPSGQVSVPVHLAGLAHPASLSQDSSGITHIRAASESDLFFLNGWVAARDRLFQMDLNRREPSGTLAELLGKPALASDVQARTIGLRRAAERTWAAAPADLRATLQSYAAGVNAYLAGHPLPPEYGALGLTSVAPWTPVDSLAAGKALAFELSFDSDVGATVQLQAYIGAFGPARGVALYSQDVMRSQPFSSASTVPDATAGHHASVSPQLSAADLARLAESARLGKAWAAKTAGNPLFTSDERAAGAQGSNEWVIAGSHTVDGHPIIANDPHLSLGMPATFYPLGLAMPGMDVEGEGFAGTPGVVLGHNQFIAWGATTNPMDVTDTYNEKVVSDSSSPSGLSTVYLGALEHVLPIPETFRYNSAGSLATATAADGVPPATLIVPRRNQGPIVQLDLAHGSALSIQYTGFSATFELQTFLSWDKARNLADFQRGLQYFDVGSQNFSYADTRGNIGYFASAEMPVREDLQAGTVNGLPPWFIRNGQGGNEWLPVAHPQPQQAIPYEIYPAAELPHVLNPAAGWFVSANNDPAGTVLDNDPLNQLRPGGGLYYLNVSYDGFRAGRITEMLRQRLGSGHARGKVSVADVQAMQADTTLLDAEYFVPWLVRAYRQARTSPVPQLAALAADPAVAEAIGRLARWNFSTPTGIAAGYDAADRNGALGQPSAGEISASVAASLYAEWRSQAVTSIVDAPLGALPKPGGADAVTALRHLLDSFGSMHGVGASGLNFFAVPGIAEPAAARDYLLLHSLSAGLTQLAGPAFAPAFHGSTNQADYRWGLLHRLTLTSPLGGPFSVPTGFGQFPQPLPGLAGIPVDGGFETVDAATHNVRGASSDGFSFGSGPARRFIGSLAPWGIRAESALPGGASAVPSSPYYLNLLRPYLTDDYYPALLAADLRHDHLAGFSQLLPG
ncbi:MAG: penicillin acylase family protein [Jatrophihabitantaceae bacterium]